MSFLRILKVSFLSTLIFSTRQAGLCQKGFWVNLLSNGVNPTSIHRKPKDLLEKCLWTKRDGNSSEWKEVWFLILYGWEASSQKAYSLTECYLLKDPKENFSLATVPRSTSNELVHFYQKDKMNYVTDYVSTSVLILTNIWDFISNIFWGNG